MDAKLKKTRGHPPQISYVLRWGQGKKQTDNPQTPMKKTNLLIEGPATTTLFGNFSPRQARGLSKQQNIKKPLAAKPHPQNGS